MAWYSTGKDAENRFAADEARKEESKKRREEGYIKRWWIPVTRSDDLGQELVFVDACWESEEYVAPFTYMEHNLKLNGTWRNWFTCLEGEKDSNGRPVICPICSSGDRPSLVAAYTIINRNSYAKKDGSTGNANKDELNLFVCKSKVQKDLRRKTVSHKGLRGCAFHAIRGTSESANTGDLFEFKEKTELSIDIKPYAYLKILAPKSVEELQKIISGESQTVKADDDLVDFGIRY